MRRGFWKKARKFAARLPFAEDLLAAYYCAFDRDTPLQVKAALIGALAYFVLPFDAVPDVLPLLGFADDAAMLATALRMVANHLARAPRGARASGEAQSVRRNARSYGCRITLPITWRAAIAFSAAAVSASG